MGVLLLKGEQRRYPGTGGSSWAVNSGALDVTGLAVSESREQLIERPAVDNALCGNGRKLRMR
jgi:hypothetical protein